MGLDFRDGMMPIEDLEVLCKEYGFYNMNTKHLLRVYNKRFAQRGEHENAESEYTKYELSKEFYTIVGLANLEKKPDDFRGTSEKSIGEELDRFSVLQKIDLYNDKLIEIRKLLYEEIKRCIVRDNEEADLYTAEFNNVVQQTVYKAFKILLTNDRDEYVELNNCIESIERYAGRTISETHRKFFTKLLHVLIDCRLASRRGTVEYNQALITAVELLDNSGYFRYSNRMWGICLLGILGGSVGNNQEYEDLVEHFDNGNNFIDELSDYYETCDNYLLENQLSANLTLTCLYQINAYPVGVFYKEKVVRDMQKVFKRSNVLKKAYADMTVLGNTGTKGKKKGSGCFAIMTVGDKKYATLSGISSKRIQVFHMLSSLLSKDYEIVKKEGSYYLDNGCAIDWHTFESSPFLSGNDKKQISNGDYDRMFSCSERKFVTKMQMYSYHKIFVKYAPCYMCERMITEEESNYSCMIEVICPISKKCTVPREQEYDDIAKRAMGLVP